MKWSGNEVAAILEEANLFFPCNKARFLDFKRFSVHHGYCLMILQYPSKGKDLAQKYNGRG